MRTNVIKFKKQEISIIEKILRDNNLQQCLSILPVMSFDQEYVILQEKLFDGFKIAPKWELENKAWKLDGLWYNWYIKSNDSWPEELFDRKTMKPYDTPWGMVELHMPWSLFRVSNQLIELFQNIPRCTLHDFLDDYSKGSMHRFSTVFNGVPSEWPISLDVAIDNKTKISFFTPKKITELLKSDALGYTSFFNKDRTLSDCMSDIDLRQKKATMTTFHRAIEKLCVSAYRRPWNSSVENQFSDTLMLNGVGDLDVKLVLYDAKHIPWAYDGESYHTNIDGHTSGTLGRSCMRSHEDQKKVAFYAKLGDNLKILVLQHKDGSVMGRALIWQNCYNRRRKDSFQVMDRVYSTENRYEVLFHHYAITNNIIRKKLNSYTNNTLVQPNGKGGVGACLVQLPNKIKDQFKLEGENRLLWPWLDTFKFYDVKANALVTHKQLGGEYFMQSTSGRYSRVRYDDYKSVELISIMQAKNLEVYQ